MDLAGLGRLLALVGLALFAAGVVLWLAARWGGLPSWLGRLPGDIVLRREGFTFYFPLASSILASLLLSLILYLMRR